MVGLDARRPAGARAVRAGGRERSAGATRIGFLVRAGVLGLLASLWWVVPVLVHVHYGINFLQYTEQPATIWGTNSLTESLRLMGYWTSYLGVGFGINRPFSTDASTLLFNPLVIAASLLMPALAVAGFVRARRISYAPAAAAARGRRRADRDGGLPRRDAGARDDGVDLSSTSSCSASCARPTRRRRWSRSGWRGCSGSGCARRSPGRARRATRLAVRARPIAIPVAAGRADRVRLAAADPRLGDRHPAVVHAASRSLAPGRRRTSTATCPPTAGRWSCPARSSPTTTGAGRWTRCSRG